MSPDRDVPPDALIEDEDALVHLAGRLEHGRPVPTARFRSDLRRRLLARGAGPARPARLRLLISGYASAGTALLLLGALSASGIVPVGG